MASLNKVCLIGHLGKAPEVRSFNNGGKICTFSLATSETWRDKAGERKERTEWHNISIMVDGLIGVAEKYLHKGSKVYIEGQLQTRKWVSKGGEDHYATEVVLRPYNSTLIMLDGPKHGSTKPSSGRTKPGSEPEPDFSDDPIANNDMNDEVPF